MLTSNPTGASQLTKHLAEVFTFTEVKEEINHDSDVFHVTIVIPNGLESVLPYKGIPLIVFRSNQTITHEQLNDLKKLQNDLDIPNRFSIFIPIQNTIESRDQIHKVLGGISRENIVVLGRENWLDIITSKQLLHTEFMQNIQEQVDLYFLSPYQETAPTKLDMFYGRTKEISQISEAIDNVSVVLLGARRIGKTSLLQATQQVLESRKKILLYMDCYYINNILDFFGEISDKWRTYLPKLNRQSGLDDFMRAIRQLKTQNKSIVFQFDEVDRLLEFDYKNNQESLFRMFRSLAQQNYCQFIFSGERRLLDQMTNPISAFYNFAIRVQLGLLDEEKTADLVKTPMKLIGIILNNEKEALHKIFLETDGHPNLVQYLCGKLIDNLSKTKTRVIELDDINSCISKTDFRDRYLSTFWAQATPLEKAISICIDNSNVECTLQHIYPSLQKEGFDITTDQIQRGLRYLELSQLLKEENGAYQIRVTRFSSYIQQLSYDKRIQDLLIEWKDDQRSRSQ